MKELLIRSVFGLVFLAVVFVPIAADLLYGWHTFNLTLLLFALIGIRELYRMAGTQTQVVRNPLPGQLAAVIMFAPLLYSTLGDFLPLPALEFDLDQLHLLKGALGLLVLGSFIYYIQLIFADYSIEFIFRRPLLLALFYPLLPVLLLAFGWTFHTSDARALLIFVLLPIYLNDSLAYVSGRFLGKHKLIPTVSPKKTWEGFIGGIAGALIVMHLIAYFGNYYTLISPVILTLICIMASLLATLGDLFESKLKRTAGVKDSGTILPGHGGILDRIDAMLFVAPVLYVLLTFIL